MLLEYRFAKTKFVPKISTVTQWKVIEKFTEIRFAKALYYLYIHLPTIAYSSSGTIVKLAGIGVLKY